MKKMFAGIVSFCILLASVVPICAVERVWDLEEMPDFAGHLLSTYGDLSAAEAVLLDMEEAEYDDAHLLEISSSVSDVIDDLAFLPDETVSSVQGEDLLMLYFVQPNWKTDASPITHVYMQAGGVRMVVWDRVSQVEHYAYVNCETEQMIAEIRSIMQKTVETVEQKRTEKEQTANEEKSQYETELISFEKLYSAQVTGAKLQNQGIEASLDFELGICAYETILKDGVHYAFYFSGKDNPALFYITDHIDADNVVTFYGTQIYKNADDGKYSLYDKGEGSKSIIAKIYVDENGSMNRIDFQVVNANVQGVIEKEQIAQSGTLKDYGDLKITYTREVEQTEPEKTEDKAAEEPTEKPETESEKKPEQVTEQKQETEPVQKESEKESVNAEKDAAEPSAAKEEPADVLHALGLFRGTDNGYDLESAFTRAQGAAMLVRLLGQEAAVLEKEPTGVFSDVPPEHWAAPYVEYCYRNGITRGTGADTYSPDAFMNASQYITLVLRALGYIDAEPETAGILAAECGLLTNAETLEILQADTFDRERMVYVSYCALTTELADGGTLIQKLVYSGAANEQTAEKQGLLK